MIAQKDNDPVLIANISTTNARLTVKQAFEKYKDEWDISIFKLQRWINDGKIAVDKDPRPKQPSLIHEDSLLQYLRDNVERKQGNQTNTDLLKVYEQIIAELKEDLREMQDKYDEQVRLNLAMVREIPNMIQDNNRQLLSEILEVKKEQQKLLESTQTKKKRWGIF